VCDVPGELTYHIKLNRGGDTGIEWAKAGSSEIPFRRPTHFFFFCKIFWLLAGTTEEESFKKMPLLSDEK
jgi:hypothetical protein